MAQGKAGPVVVRLRELGLPECLFDADFAEQHREAEKRHAVMLQRLRELERRESEWCAELPWADARKEWEQGGEALDETACQGSTPHYIQPLRRFFKLLDDAHDPRFAGYQKKKDVKIRARKRAEREGRNEY